MYHGNIWQTTISLICGAWHGTITSGHYSPLIGRPHADKVIQFIIESVRNLKNPKILLLGNKQHVK